jgi:SAM-dependent methyltransferase
VDDLQLIIDLHKDGARQGPGGDDQTRLAVALSGLQERSDLCIADIGCGTGASTRVLARELDAHITAVDFLPEFLVRLADGVDCAGIAGRVTALEASMEALPFAAEAYDAIWSEGAIYNMGFARGIAAWRKYLKPRGIIAVSELTWLSDRRPDELQAHWAAAYPEVDTASAKIGVLESSGFAPLGYFPLPQACWLDNYYRPMQQRFPAFLDRHDHSAAARDLVAAEEREIALFEKYSDFVSYGYYIAQKLDADTRTSMTRGGAADA